MSTWECWEGRYQGCPSPVILRYQQDCHRPLKGSPSIVLVSFHGSSASWELSSLYMDKTGLERQQLPVAMCTLKSLWPSERCGQVSSLPFFLSRVDRRASEVRPTYFIQIFCLFVLKQDLAG